MTRSARRLASLLLPALLAWAAGCSGGSTGTINGTVTLDGQPLKTGEVRFVPADGKGQTASASITDGKFTATVPPGQMRVEFSVPKVIGKRKMYDTPDSPVVEETTNLLPDRYHTKSDIKITIKGGSQDETFDLKSK